MRSPRCPVPKAGRPNSRLVGILAVALLGVCVVFPFPLRAEKTQPIHISSVQDGPYERVYFYSRSHDEAKLVSLHRTLVDRGARGVNCLLPRVVVCELPAGMSAGAFTADPDISVVFESRIDTKSADGGLFEPGWIKRCYTDAEEQREGELTQTPAPGWGPVDSWGEPALTVPEETVMRTCTQSASGYPEPRNIQQNSELMVGIILVNLIFPESQPYAANHEDWTDDAISDANSQFMLAALYYQNASEYRKAGIHFVFRSIEGVSTNDEPIDQPWGATSWIVEVMDRLGYEDDGSPDRHLTAVHEFNNDKRNEFKTQWVFTALIANAELDADHMFAQARDIGWGYLGGPYFVIPHPAGSSYTAQAVRHYVGTMFWALEEGVGKQDGCASFSGYLNVQNRNKVVRIDQYGGEVGCAGMRPPVSCIMNHIHAFSNGYTGEPCEYTSQMLGISDANNSSIPDCFDAPPVIYFEHSAVETVFAQDFFMRFRAVSEGVPNRNPLQVPALRVNYALPVGFVGLSERGVITRQILPIDGVCDELEEDFAVDFDLLPAGPSSLSFVTRNSVGAKSGEQTKKIYLIGLTYMHFGYQNFNEGNLISLTLYGETFDAGFDVHRIDLDGDQVDKVIATGKKAGQRIGQFTRFEYFDSTTALSCVVPGDRYRYRVCGIFTTTYHDRDTTVTAETHELETRAMIPVPPGSIVSNSSPNPFRESTLISVLVPTIYDDPRLLNAVAMDVDVSVFDVLGRRVRRLFADNMIGQVVTLAWDGTNESREKVPAGVYFVKAVAGTAEGTSKVVIVR